MPPTADSAARQATGTFFNALNGEEYSMKPGKGGSPAERRISSTFLSCFPARKGNNRCRQLGRQPGAAANPIRKSGRKCGYLFWVQAALPVLLILRRAY